MVVGVVAFVGLGRGTVERIRVLVGLVTSLLILTFPINSMFSG